MAEPKIKKVPGLRIRALVNGFRRAGRAWSVEALDIAASEFTKEQIAQLKAEPGLAVTEIEIDTVAE